MNRSVLEPFGARIGALGLPDKQIVRALADRTPEILNVPARSERKRSGERPTFDLLLSGWAFRFRYLADGTRHIGAVILAGDPLDIDVVEYGDGEFQVATLTQCRIASIDAAAFRPLYERNEVMRRAVTVLAMVENAMLREWSVCLAHRSATQRLAHLFCELQVRLAVVGEADDEGFEFPLTQAHLAELLGLTPVHVNRTLQSMRAERLIELSGQRLVVPSWDALARVAEFSPSYLRMGSVRMPEGAR